MKIVVDMNLPPAWVDTLSQYGWSALHWSQVGSPTASDAEIMDWARANGFVVFTHDLDFTTLLALTHASGPSVLQVRTQNVMPAYLETIVVSAIKMHEAALIAGALVSVDEVRSRIRVLPL